MTQACLNPSVSGSQLGQIQCLLSHAVRRPSRYNILQACMCIRFTLVLCKATHNISKSCTKWYVLCIKENIFILKNLLSANPDIYYLKWKRAFHHHLAYLQFNMNTYAGSVCPECACVLNGEKGISRYQTSLPWEQKYWAYENPTNRSFIPPTLAIRGKRGHLHTHSLVGRSRLSLDLQ